MKYFQLFISTEAKQLLVPEQSSKLIWTNGWQPLLKSLSSVVIEAGTNDYSDADQAHALQVVNNNLRNTCLKILNVLNNYY